MCHFLYKFLYSLISFIFALFFILLGIIAILLPFSPTIRSDFIEFVLQNSIAISLFGFGFLLIGAVMLANLYLNTRHHYYNIRVGNRLVEVDEAIIHHYLNTYWNQLFPQQETPTRLRFKKNTIKIIADLPYSPESDRKELIERIQHDIQDIFKRILGYSHEFMLSISFQPKA